MVLPKACWVGLPFVEANLRFECFNRRQFFINGNRGKLYDRMAFWVDAARFDVDEDDFLARLIHGGLWHSEGRYSKDTPKQMIDLTS